MDEHAVEAVLDGVVEAVLDGVVEAVLEVEEEAEADEEAVLVEVRCRTPGGW